MTREEWKYIPGFEKKYSCSNTGKIMSFVKYKEGKILIPSINNRGYEYVSLGRNNKWLVHRLIAITFISNPDNLIVNHINGDKRNNSVSNLEWTTYSKNNIHAYKIGLKEVARKCKQTGTESIQGNFTKDNLKDIKDMYYSKITISTIAKLYNVHYTTIRRIIIGKTYKGEF